MEKYFTKTDWRVITKEENKLVVGFWINEKFNIYAWKISSTLKQDPCEIYLTVKKWRQLAAIIQFLSQNYVSYIFLIRESTNNIKPLCVWTGSLVCKNTLLLINFWIPLSADYYWQRCCIEETMYFRFQLKD